jgi:hypothetical protein
MALLYEAYPTLQDAVMTDNRHFWALDGGPLAEGHLVRLIYTDEAGTSAREPVCVVSGVIVHADEELRTVQRELERAIWQGVPSQYQGNFVFHATEVFSGGRHIDRDVWPFADRLDFLKAILCLPFVHDLPIFLGKVFKSDREHQIGKYSIEYIEHRLSQITNHDELRVARQKLKSFKFDGNSMAHSMAFQFAMERADHFLRENLNGSEVGTVYAEDVPHMRETLKALGLIYREPFAQRPIIQRSTDAEKAEGIWSYRTYRIDHIVEQPCFVDKRSSSLLQLADACAFAFRHYFSGKDHGEDLLYAMLGHQQALEIIHDDRWRTGWSSGLFNAAIPQSVVPDSTLGD